MPIDTSVRSFTHFGFNVRVFVDLFVLLYEIAETTHTNANRRQSRHTENQTLQRLVSLFYFVPAIHTRVVFFYTGTNTRTLAQTTYNAISCAQWMWTLNTHFFCCCCCFFTFFSFLLFVRRLHVHKIGNKRLGVRGDRALLHIHTNIRIHTPFRLHIHMGTQLKPSNIIICVNVRK